MIDLFMGLKLKLLLVVFFWVPMIGWSVNAEKFLSPFGHWMFGASNLSEQPLPADEPNEVTVNINMPGSALLYYTIPVEYFRADERLFGKSDLKIDLRAKKVTGDENAVLRAVIFVKDKNGNWFQGGEYFTLAPGEEFNTFEIKVDQAGKNLRPSGHDLRWNNFSRNVVNSIGISFYSHEPAEWQVECKDIRFDGESEFSPLKVEGASFPEKGEKYRMLQVDFNLSREYFNPFDPDEIAVDLEVIKPDGKSSRMPAFYNLNCQRELLNNNEEITAYGLPFWSVRYTPTSTGNYRMRLIAKGRKDNGKEMENFIGEWQSVEVSESDLPGFIKVSDRNNHYFEDSRGKFFYPVGMNIHSNIDRRSEQQFDLGKLPDWGSYDYDAYFVSMGRAGMNIAEIWMAAWMAAIEWDGGLNNFYGTGRYNLHNAWKLDKLLTTAAENNVYINLSLDNHGKASMRVDPEWRLSPYNLNSKNSSANGGIIVDVNKFFTDDKVMEANNKRNRYIIGRYGAYTNIFAFELWSEVDLTNNPGPEGLRDWNKKAIDYIRSIYDDNHMFTSHVCGDSGNNVRHQAMFEAPELDLVAGDAYRGNEHIVDQLLKHQRDLSFFNKPIQITEYGGSAMGGKVGNIEADIHGGLWGSMFTRQGGAPLLWWHDFIHVFNMYHHYNAFVAFGKDVDLRVWNLKHSGRVNLEKIPLQKDDFDYYLNPLFAPLPRVAVDYFDYAIRKAPTTKGYEGFAAGNNDFVFGWVYNRELMHSFPAEPAIIRASDNWRGNFKILLERGVFDLELFDTLSGMKVAEKRISHPGGTLILDFPRLKIDTAFKLKRIKNANE